MDTKLLTISIPTFDRNETLSHNLAFLLPQIAEFASRCQLSIIDNCSPTPVAESICSLLEAYPQIDCKLVRNKANLGANGNILRCFEDCETPWLWILSDDDTPKPDALATIFQHLEEYPEAVFFNFSVEHDHPRAHTFLTRGATEFIEKFESFGNSIFISTNLYRADVMRLNLRFGHHYAYSGAPQFVVLIKSLLPQMQCCLSSSTIVTFNMPPVEQQWSLITFSLGNRILLEMPLEPEVREALTRQLNRYEGGLFNLFRLVYRLVLISKAENARKESLFLYDQICTRRYLNKKRLLRRVQAAFVRLFLVFPGIGYPLLSFCYGLRRGKGFGLSRLEDRSKRL